jgi:hypothetical protein
VRVLAWILVWALLLVASAWYLWRRVRLLGRATSRLGAELATAERALTQIQREASGAASDRAGRHTATGAAGDDSAQPLAVFTGIPQAVAERRAVRKALKQSKRARRAANLPGWARRVDSDST